MKPANQKLKILYLMKILMEQTDEEHLISMAELLEQLSGYGIEAERKSVYADINVLRTFGLYVEVVPGKKGGYFVANRDFQLPELKLLVDSVLVSKFITQRKTKELIQKLERLTSVHQASLLQRQVFVGRRIKSMNESVYYNVDHIYSGINKNQQISFRYFDYAVDKEKRYRREGRAYIASPMAMVWEEEKYYLIAYDSASAQLKHYRVDKMDGIHLLDRPRQGTECFDEKELSIYPQKAFFMYGGEEHQVKLRFVNELAGVALDRFGKDCLLRPDDEDHFVIEVSVPLSPKFYGWVFSLGSGVTILSPDCAVAEFRRMAGEVAARYA